MATTKKTKKAAAPAKAATKGKAAKGKGPDASDYLKALNAGTKKASEEGFVFFDSPDLAGTSVTEWISTGNLGIDSLTGGRGIPVGRFIEVAGWEATGKTTLIDQMIGQHQASGGIAALVDNEGGRSLDYSRRLGVRPDELIAPAVTRSLESTFGALDKAIAVQESMIKRYGADAPPMLAVVDSIGGAVTEAELKGEAGDSHVGVAARRLKQEMRRLQLRIIDARVAVVLSNHLYKRIGMPGNEHYGGSGIKYFCHLRLLLTRTGALKIGDREVGQIVRVSLKKTRVTAPKPPVETGLIWGAGFDNSYTLFEWGKENGVGGDHKWITRSGSWFFLNPPGSDPIGFQGQWLGLGNLFVERPEVYQAIVAAYREAT